jgi:hypothetical protein
VIAVRGLGARAVIKALVMVLWVYSNASNQLYCKALDAERGGTRRQQHASERCHDALHATRFDDTSADYRMRCKLYQQPARSATAPFAPVASQATQQLDDSEGKFPKLHGRRVYAYAAAVIHSVQLRQPLYEDQDFVEMPVLLRYCSGTRV